MKLPVTYKAFLKILLQIGEHGNDYYDRNLSHADQLKVGSCIADIQNWLGENQELLEKYGLRYNE